MAMLYSFRKKRRNDLIRYYESKIMVAEKAGDTENATYYSRQLEKEKELDLYPNGRIYI